MRRVVFLIRFSILAAASSGIQVALADPIYVDQGKDWTAAEREDFYTRDQGSRLINLAWLQALKQQNGQPFLADGLSRYGFLPNPIPGNPPSLPIGVHVTSQGGSQIVGITCSACHTRQLEVGGKSYRIDGGPAFIDFQAFLSDLDTAVGEATASDASFAAFAAAVLQSATPAAIDVAALRNRVDAWHRRFHAYVAATLPPVGPLGWGLGRIDAVGIIFNRISGTDIGPPPDFLIPENMRIADAPVRFPFLWNSPKQYLTDWAGFVLNGTTIFAMSRNTGQALSFANFEPKRSSGSSFSYANTIDFDSLNKLEELLKQMGPPKWPWPINSALAADGGKIFKRECDGCHGIKDAFSLFDPLSWLSPGAWATPVTNVGTDTHQFDELGWTVKTGSMAGAGFPLIAKHLQEEDYAVHMMFSAVAGTILEYKLGRGTGGSSSDGFGTSLTPNTQTPSSSKPGSSATPHSPPQAPAGQPDSLTIESWTLLSRTLKRGEYEARVLQGIWAAAPYLHNGSVASLAELLTPPAQRKPSFDVGPNYDPDKVGLADVQPGSNPRPLTGCSEIEIKSGNSRCGHDFGTKLPNEEKKALLEYLKTL